MPNVKMPANAREPVEGERNDFESDCSPISCPGAINVDTCCFIEVVETCVVRFEGRESCVAALRRLEAGAAATRG